MKNIDTSNEISRNVPTTEDDAGDFPANDDFLPFDDDGDMVQPPPPEDSSLMGSGMADITNSNDHSSLNIGFGDSPVQDETNKKRKSQSARKAKKKRRKVITDDSELSSDHIREMLEDTAPTLMKDPDLETSKSTLTVEERLYHACIAEGALIPESNLVIWKRNMSMHLGKANQYEMQDVDGDSIEARRDATGEDAEMPPVDPQDDSFPTNDEPQDDDMIPFDDDQPPMMDDGAMPPPDISRK